MILPMREYYGSINNEKISLNECSNHWPLNAFGIKQQIQGARLNTILKKLTPNPKVCELHRIRDAGAYFE